jgi:hypothetical protein
VRVDDAGHRHPHRRDDHDHLGVGRRRKTKSAILLTDRRAEESELFHLLYDRRRISVLVVVLANDRLELAHRPALDGAEQLGILAGI